MPEFRYKAFISYSHRDEAWAKWLHRALESYRVPRNLVGTRTSAGEVPARIRPVFRDREDLSSASDLSGSVRQVLAETENLIVICSPDAAASHWVGEEIREFARLGRQSQVFCMIVDGEPGSSQPDKNCFQSALGDIGLTEPLAADVRSWADGKRFSLLKLISGILGIRLDELRQRDLQRRRKRKVVASLGVMAALTLGAITVLSQISEQHEREKTEQLATFIVDLGERLSSDADLETRALISEQASKHLESLDPARLSPETGIKVALAFRQLGLVGQGQGRSDEAFTAFQRSRNLLSALVKKYPQVLELMYQLGSAEYYIGNLHHDQGHYNKALAAMQRYHELNRALLEKDPDNPDWLMELSYSHNNLAALQLGNGLAFDKKTQSHVAEAVRLAEKVKRLKPDDKAVADGYTTVLAWAADAQHHGCNLDEAMSLRKKVTELRKASSQSDPGNNDLKKRYAFDLTGLGILQIAVGQLDPAEANLALAILLLRQLSVADPSNVAYQEEALIRQFWLARLIGETGKLDEAELLIKQLEPKLKPGRKLVDHDSPDLDEYIDLLIALSDIEFQLGDMESANRNLQDAVQLQLDHSDPQVWDSSDKRRMLRARYQWWEHNGNTNLQLFNIPWGEIDESDDEFRRCADADIAARMYVIEGNSRGAAKQVDYLKERSYADPAFIRFCKKHELCS